MPITVQEAPPTEVELISPPNTPESLENSGVFFFASTKFPLGMNEVSFSEILGLSNGAGTNESKLSLAFRSSVQHNKRAMIHLYEGENLNGLYAVIDPNGNVLGVFRDIIDAKAISFVKEEPNNEKDLREM